MPTRLCAVLALVAFPALADPTLPPMVRGPMEGYRDDTEVHFLAHRGEDQYRVTVGDQSCETPCTLRLKPGPTKIHLLGPGESDIQVVIPHLTAQVRVHTGPPAWYQTAGAIMIPVGVVMGVSMWALGFACSRDGACLALNVTAWPVLGLALIITGSVLLGLYTRNHPVDANRTEILDAGRKSPLRFEGLSLGPIVGGGAGLLAFSF